MGCVTLFVRLPGSGEPPVFGSGRSNLFHWSLSAVSICFICLSGIYTLGCERLPALNPNLPPGEDTDSSIGGTNLPEDSDSSSDTGSEFSSQTDDPESDTPSELETDSDSINFDTEPVVSPTFEPGGGDFHASQIEVRLQTTTPGATILYTTDESPPQVELDGGPSGSTLVYQDEPIQLNGTTTLKAVTFHKSRGRSTVANATYNLWEILYNVDVGNDGSLPSSSLGSMQGVADRAYYADPGPRLRAEPDSTGSFWGWGEWNGNGAARFGEEQPSHSIRRGWEAFKKENTVIGVFLSYRFQVDDVSPDETSKYHVRVASRWHPEWDNDIIGACPLQLELYTTTESSVVPDNWAPETLKRLGGATLKANQEIKEFEGEFDSNETFIDGQDPFRTARIVLVNKGRKKAGEECNGDFYDAPLAHIQLKRLIK